MAVNYREAYEELPQVKMQRAIRSYQRHIVPRQAALIEAWAHGEHPADEDGEVAFIESTRPFRRQMAAYFGGATGNTALIGCRWLMG